MTIFFHMMLPVHYSYTDAAHTGFIATYNNSVIGYLLKKLPAKIPSLDDILPPPGKKMDDPRAPLSSRRKWMAQVRHTVSQLHSRGLAWGFASPKNVLVDEEDNAWIMPIGTLQGGYWSDEALPGMEQDLSGLRRLEDDILPGEDKAML